MHFNKLKLKRCAKDRSCQKHAEQFAAFSQQFIRVRAPSRTPMDNKWRALKQLRKNFSLELALPKEVDSLPILYRCISSILFIYPFSDA